MATKEKGHKKYFEALSLEMIANLAVSFMKHGICVLTRLRDCFPTRYQIERLKKISECRV